MSVLVRILLPALVVTATACSVFDRARYEHDVEVAVTAGDTSLGYRPLAVTEIADLEPDSWVAIVRERSDGQITITRGTKLKVVTVPLDSVLRAMRAQRFAHRRVGRVPTGLYDVDAVDSDAYELMLTGRLHFMEDSGEPVDMPLYMVDHLVLQTGPDPIDESASISQFFLAILIAGVVFLIGLAIFIVLALEYA